MAVSGSIHYLRNHEVDRARWDACIDNADNGLIYGYSFYLDTMCDHWDALILDDYAAVMPLPWRRKYAIYYLYQPYYIATLGVFGNKLSEDVLAQFLDAIPSKFRYWDLDLNEGNRINEHFHLSNVDWRKRTNTFLKLDTYQTIYSKYSRLAKRKLIKAKQEGIQVTRNIPASDVIDHYINEYEKKNRIIPDAVYLNLKNLLQHCNKEYYQTYLATAPQCEIAGFYLIYIDRKFVYSILGGSTIQGKSKGAFYLLTDAAIQDFAGTQKIFRFEGSDIPGISFFNSQFGSYATTYLHIKRNLLPYPIRWLK